MYNIMNHTKEILIFKNQLLFPKRSDKFTIQYYLDGWRTCEVTIGSKKATVNPLFGRGKKTFSIQKIREELANLYWYAARCDATKTAQDQGRKKKRSGWEHDYA